MYSTQNDKTRVSTIIVFILFAFIQACGDESLSDESLSDESLSDEENQYPDIVEQRLGQQSVMFLHKSCSDNPQKGCIDGFISHGHRLTIRRDETDESFEVRDATDLFDQFGDLFIKPLFESKDEEMSDFTVKLEPALTRDSFAKGFSMYLEGLQAYDRVVMQQEGNFSFIDLAPALYKLRILKEISLTIKSKSDGAKTAQCLVFEHVTENIALDPSDPAYQTFHIGGIHDFNFYIKKGDGACTPTRAVSNRPYLPIPKDVRDSQVTDESDNNGPAEGNSDDRFNLTKYLYPNQMDSLSYSPATHMLTTSRNKNNTPVETFVIHSSGLKAGSNLVAVDRTYWVRHPSLWPMSAWNNDGDSIH
jgi:hypothetical protein